MRNSNLNRFNLLPPLFLLIIPFLLYLTRITHWTPYPDEIAYAFSAKDFLEQGHYLFKDLSFSHYFNPPANRSLFVYLSCFLQFLGFEPIFSVRILSAFFGAASLMVIFLLLSKFYPRKLSFASSFSLISMYYFNTYTRLGHVETIHLFFALLSILFLLVALPAKSHSFLLLSGLFLGITFWTKESAIIYLLASILFLFIDSIIGSNKSFLMNLFVFSVGLIPPLTALMIFLYMNNSDMLYEVSFQRPYDVNMISAPLILNIKYTLKNLISVLGIPNHLRFLVGIPLIFSLGFLFLRAIYKKNKLSLFIACYFLIAFPFFTWYYKKFIYYFLPSALFLFVIALCELGIYFNNTINPLSCIKDKFVSLFQGKRFFLHSIYLFSLIFVSSAIIINIPKNAKLYSTRGAHAAFEDVLFHFNPGDKIIASHSILLKYINDKFSLSLNIIHLFNGPHYRLNMKEILNSNTKAIITKEYYYNRLSKRNEKQWFQVMQLFPVICYQDGVIIFFREE